MIGYHRIYANPKAPGSLRNVSQKHCGTLLNASIFEALIGAEHVRQGLPLPYMVVVRSGVVFLRWSATVVRRNSACMGCFGALGATVVVWMK